MSLSSAPSLSGRQKAWADHDGYLLGSTWESYGNGRIWNMLDASAWSEPEEMPEQLPLLGHPCEVCKRADCQVLEDARAE